MKGKTQAFTTRQNMLSNMYEIYRYSDQYLKEVSLHHHDFYEIYLFLNGNVNYGIDGRNFRLLPGDILLISPLELHRPYISEEKFPYERIVLWINKKFLEHFNTENTVLTRCFDTSIPGHTNLLRFSPATSQHFTELMENLAAESSSKEYGSDIISVGYLTELLVKLNRQVINSNQHHELNDRSAPIINDIVNYINTHYQEELSLEFFAAKFFMNKHYLSHEFKRLVGTSIYRYIIQKRLAISKQLLLSGTPPKHVYQSCGFRDYSNFYRAFKAEYNISPKNFYISADSGKMYTCP